MTPQAALRAIEALEKFGIDLGVERIAACMAALGRPQDAYPSLHVGGTNGKGSTAALLAETLTASGYRTGLYTSPPLETFGERIRVDGLPLDDACLPTLLEAVRAACGRIPGGDRMTQFEVITALAFLHFARAAVDAAVIEVGLGGRLDSTNVITPAVSIITNVGLEHTEHLGSTVSSVAGEKAGIVKPGVPLVTAATGEALTTLLTVAASRGAPVRALGRDFHVTRDAGGRYAYRGARWHLEDLELGLLGGYQRANLGAALAALELLEEGGWNLPEDDLRAGLRRVRWPGRMELLGSGPRVLLDGAHNPHASRVLAQALREDVSYSQLTLVLGILGDKDARSILADLVPLAHKVVLTRSSSVRSWDLEGTRAAVEPLTRAPVLVLQPVAAALEQALAEATDRELICVTGSLTTVGEARTYLRLCGWVR